MVHVFTEAVSLGLLEPSREADIVAGELQSFALPPSFGGPYAGVLAAKEKFVRQMPGRLVGETKDARGRLTVSGTQVERLEREIDVTLRAHEQRNALVEIRRLDVE